MPPPTSTLNPASRSPCVTTRNPRSFAFPDDNCCDVHSNDLGFLVVRVHVAAVVVRERERELELARQVPRSVNRVGLRRATGHRLAVEPDLMIRPRSRQQVIRHLPGNPQDLLSQPARQRRGARDHVAYYVTARAQRRHEHVVDGADRRLEIALEHGVELVTLARRDPQRAVAVVVRQLIDHEVLLSGEHAARDLAADHELVSRLGVRATSLTAPVAILLLVRPVELEELSASVRERVGARGELVGETPTQAAALLFHLLDRAQRLVGHATTTSRSPSASTWPTSGRLNSGGGSVPLRSISRTLVPESVTWDSASCGQVLGDAMPPQRWQ